MMRSVIALSIVISAGMAHAQDFSKLVPTDSKLEKLAGGLQFIEGPVWSDDDGGFLIFSDIPGNKLLRWDSTRGLKTFREPSNNANGNTRDREGKLVSCEHSSRRLTITDKDGSVKVLVDSFGGKKFNSPNDVVVRSDGTIWFTDPPYGTPRNEKRELDKQHVFCFTPLLRSTKSVADDFDRPNGLCFSPDEKKLYIADSGEPHHIRVFTVSRHLLHAGDAYLDGFELKDGNVFCAIDNGVPDGIRCDSDGNVWSSAGDAIHVFSPEGKLLGKIPVPQTPANLCFGGADRKTLYITAKTSLYRIRVNVAGAN